MWNLIVFSHNKPFPIFFFKLVLSFIHCIMYRRLQCHQVNHFRHFIWSHDKRFEITLLGIFPSESILHYIPPPPPFTSTELSNQSEPSQKLASLSLDQFYLIKTCKLRQLLYYSWWTGQIIYRAWCPDKYWNWVKIDNI